MPGLTEDQDLQLPAQVWALLCSNRLRQAASEGLWVL